MLRIAVPNKGSLAETAAQMLFEAGYTGRRDPRDLHVADPRNEVEFFYLRPRDIATYVGSGALDVGITGRDLLLDSGSAAAEIAAARLRRLDLPLRRARRRASPSSPTSTACASPRATRASSATSSPTTASRSKLVKLDGAVESAVRLGVADAVADVVSTGTTLRKAGLEIFGPVILESEAVLIGSGVETAGRRHAAAPPAGRARRAPVRAHRLRRAGRAPRARPPRPRPGFESPTVSPLHDPEWVAVRVMIPRVDMNHVMDELYELGARAILVSAIHAARL